METALPNLHPALIHFPLAVIPLALLCDLAVLATRKAWLDRTAALLWAVGALGAIGAVLSGRDAADGLVDVAAKIEPLIGAHSDLAHQVLYALLVLVALRLAVTWKRPEVMVSAPRLLLLAAAFGVQSPLLIAADRGGHLVYGNGVSVDLPVQEQPRQPDPVITTLSDPPESRLQDDPQGTVTWAPAAGDGAALGTLIMAPEGAEISGLQALAPPSAEGLVLQVTGRALLLLPGLFDDVKVEARLDRSDFQGTVGLLHHVHSHDSHDSFVLVAPQGETRLDQTKTGTSEVLDSAKTNAGDVVLMEVRAAGSHLKGFLGGEMVVHGHAHPTGAGQVGLLLDGQGTVRVLLVRATPIGGRPQTLQEKPTDHGDHDHGHDH
jgi:uncharacterized membrane protein